MSKLPTSVFPAGSSPINTDPNLYLLHCRYSRQTDTLRLLYKNIKTGEKILEEKHNPLVPVFFANQKPKFFEEYVPYENTYTMLVPQRGKSKAIQNNLFPIKSWKFRDKITGLDKIHVKVDNMKDETLKKKPEYLHPQLLFADVPIEHLCYMEYCMPRYQDVGSGVRMEVVDRPELNYASFDIETSYDDNNNMYINMNTFVDDKTKTAYADYLERDYFPGQDWIKNNPKEFEAKFKETFKWAIENMELDAKPDKIKLIKDVCYEYLNTIKIKTRGHQTEQKLIWESMDLMFTQCQPDMLMAFNTGFDMPMFYRRSVELGMPIGTINMHTKEWIETPPPLAEDLDDNWQLRADQIDPKKRSTAFDNISKTHIVDYANAYYSNRKGSTFSSMSLDATANREIGLGKLDYSKICNHILKLPFTDFITHTIYALIDSLLLVILERITHDFDSKLTYMMRTKSDMKTTASNNQAISRCIHAEAFYAGQVAGNNWKKYLGKFTKEELKGIQEITNIDYIKLIDLYDNLPGKNKGEIKGGLVGNPNKIVSMFKKLANKFNILNKEVVLTRFKKFLYAIYIDAKSRKVVALIKPI